MSEAKKDEVEAAVRKLVAAILSGEDPDRPDDEVRIVVKDQRHRDAS